MNIFIIPSWYPTKQSPVTGRFFVEQVLVYAREYRSDNIAISRWGQGEFIVNLLSPLAALKKVFSYIKAKDFEENITNNVTEFYFPAIEIRPRKYAGAIKQIINANIENFKNAKQKYGNIDIIHAHVSFPAGFIAKQLSDKFGVPYVLTEHMGPFPFPFYLEKEKLSNKLSIAFEHAAKVIAVSRFLEKEMAKYGIKTDIVIPNLVDDDFFTCRNRDKDGETVFFMVGRITKEKGVDMLLRAFAAFAENKVDVCLKIGGSGSDMPEMIELADNLNISAKVKWLGELDKNAVFTNMCNCDVFVSASTYETFGMSVSEALFCGKPVIATRSGGVEDMLDDENAILVEIGNAHEMSMAMQKMYDSIASINTNEIRRKHVAKFGKKVVMAKLRDCYFDVLKNR